MSEPFASFDELLAEARATFGVRLFTVSAVTPSRTEVSRVYTTDAATYPVGGLKPAGDLEAERAHGTSFYPDTASIVRVFPDHAVVTGLGLGTSINVPVIDDDRVIGSLNFLDAEGSYTPETVPAAEQLTLRAQHLVVAAVAALGA